jgi:hypothetical protein
MPIPLLGSTAYATIDQPKKLGATSNRIATANPLPFTNFVCIFAPTLASHRNAAPTLLHWLTRGTYDY